MRNNLAVVILAYNEELNIGQCLESVAGWADEIFVIDGGPNGSYSTDKTLEIAKNYGAKIFSNPFENQAQQFNWALDKLPIENEWILRLDADEYLTEELKKEISEVLPKTPAEVSGYYIKRRVYFMGRWIKHGGYYPVWILRLFRKNKARSEEKAMNEHLILLEGEAAKLNNDFIHNDRKDLSYWTEKHNGYATREVEDIVENRRQNLKHSFYYRLPLFGRAFLYFIYRYFFRFGFLDGKQGLIYHFLHGCWYRFLTDAKIYEQRKKEADK